MDSTAMLLAALALQHSGELGPLGSKVLDTAKYLLSPVIDPLTIHRKADAKGYEIITTGKAKATAKAVAKQITQRMEHRLFVQELRHQQNIESIVTKAAHEKVDIVSKEPVDQDWVHRFFRVCEDVSDPQMQSLFAKLFAGEVAQPRTFSRRAISLVQDMSSADAKLMDKACSLYWFIEPPTPGAFIPHVVLDTMPHLLNFDELTTLDEIGVLYAQFGLLTMPPSGSVLRYGSRRFAVDERSPAGIPTYNVTKPGQELYRILSPKEPPEYLDKSLEFFRGPTVGLKVSPLT